MQGIVACAVGFLVADAELRTTAKGTPLLNFRLAVVDKQGEGTETTEYVRVTVWDRKASELHDAGKLVKGCEVYTEGHLRLSEWTSQTGEKRSGLQLSAWTVQALGSSSIGRRPGVAARS